MGCSPRLSCTWVWYEIWTKLGAFAPCPRRRIAPNHWTPHSWWMVACQVYATDRDAGDNGKVEYFIIDDPSGFFTINHYTGWITVARPMAGVRHTLHDVAVWYSHLITWYFQDVMAHLFCHKELKSTLCSEKKHPSVKTLLLMSGLHRC